MEPGYERWQETAQYKPDWNGRYQLINKFIPEYASDLDSSLPVTC